MRMLPTVLSLLLLGASASYADTPATVPAPHPAGGEPVIGVSFRGAHRAYPLGIFARRRVVNDVVGRQEVAVFHDPDRGVSAAWFRTVLGEPLEFSGEAVGSLADDLTTVTRWDMTTGEAVGGNLAGQRLVALPLTTTSWESWLAAHPTASLFAPEGP